MLVLPQGISNIHSSVILLMLLNAYFMKKINYAMLIVMALMTALSCNNLDEQPQNIYQTHKTTNYTGDLAHQWMQISYEMIKENHLYGPHAARAYGYLGLTLWESVYLGIPNARSLAGQINDYPLAPSFDELQIYDWGVVLSTAMRTVLPVVIDNISAAQRSTISLLAEQQETNMLDNGISRDVFDASTALGEAIAARIVTRARNDGRDIIRNIVPQLPVRDDTHPWYWDHNTYSQIPVEPMWGTLRTFVVAQSMVCEPEPPYDYSTALSSPFFKDAKEIYEAPKSEPNKRLAYHFDNGPGRTCSAACHWISITEQFLKKDDRNLAVSAKAYCLVGLAAADAFSTIWYSKYKYNLLRPATYIKEQLNPAWEPLLSTPPYPDYLSSAATIGGAVPVVLVSVVEDRTFVDRTHVGSPLYTPDGGPFLLPERQFQSITQCGEEQAESRIVGGVHFRKACTEGLKSGRCVGKAILDHLNFGF